MICELCDKELDKSYWRSHIRREHNYMQHNGGGSGGGIGNGIGGGIGNGIGGGGVYSDSGACGGPSEAVPGGGVIARIILIVSLWMVPLRITPMRIRGH